MGPIIFELTVREALEQGILPEFEIHHYGLTLREFERVKYENLSRRIRDVGKKIKELGHQKGIHDSNIIRTVQKLVNREDELMKLGILLAGNTPSLWKRRTRSSCILTVRRAALFIAMNTSKYWYLWAKTRTITTQVNITSLVFEFEGRTIAGEAVDLSGRPLNRGDVWRGPLPGIPYVLGAGSKDIYYRYAPRPGVTKEAKFIRSHRGGASPADCKGNR